MHYLCYVYLANKLSLSLSLSPDREAEYCDDGVSCVFACVCVSVREHISENTRAIFTKFLRVLPMAVDRSSSGGVAIRYVLPVLWNTSYLRISQGSSTWPPSWSKHSPHAALDLAINGALRASGLIRAYFSGASLGPVIGRSGRVEYLWRHVCYAMRQSCVVAWLCTVSVGGSYTDQQLEGFMLVAVPLNAQDESTAMGTFQVNISAASLKICLR